MQADDELTEYEYNGLNQLVAMSSGDASTEYIYDARGNQIKEETTVSADTGQDESEASIVTTDMEYSVTGEMISLTKSDGSTTTLTQENVYNHDGIRISREENGVKREYYYDGGTVAFTKDGNDISSVNILSPEGAAIGTYRGETNDPGQWHLYAYCANNPINYVDPSGHVKKKASYRPQNGDVVWCCLKTTKKILKSKVMPYYKNKTTKALLAGFVRNSFYTDVFTFSTKKSGYSKVRAFAKITAKKLVCFLLSKMCMT